MTADTHKAQVETRLRLAGIQPGAGVIDHLDAYLALLRRWNQRINLTAFPLDPPSDDAIDRLIVEPMAASSSIRRNDQFCIDIGSGGGSPAIPLKIACRLIRLTMVEARVRKSAFLREAVRSLGLVRAEVETCRFDEAWVRQRPGLVADLVTIRAVRLDAELWAALDVVVAPAGRIFCFGSPASPAESTTPGNWIPSTVSLGVGDSVLTILSRRV